MYKVLILSREGDAARSYLRQTKGGRAVSLNGEYQFYVNEKIDEPDFLFVRGKAFKNPYTLRVAPQNIFLLTSEPPSVLRYPKGYCRQFATVLTCQPSLHTGNNVYVPPVLPWLVGIVESKKGNTVNLTYDDFCTQPDSLPKTKLMSVISSDKTFTTGHRRRRHFVERLKQRYGDQIDFFGEGINPFDDKWDVLAPYKYHVVIENSVEPLYWTEKLSDCYLTDTFPIYCGCPDVDQFFPREAYEPFSMENFDKACSIIDSVIARNLYEQSRQARAESKKLVLEKYNIFEIIAQACSLGKPEAKKETITIQPAQRYFNLHNAYVQNLGHLVGNILWKLGIF